MLWKGVPGHRRLGAAASHFALHSLCPCVQGSEKFCNKSPVCLNQFLKQSPFRPKVLPVPGKWAFGETCLKRKI